MSPTIGQSSGLETFFSRYGGATFNDGLYRVITPKVGTLAYEFLKVAFPEFSSSVAPFATDWLGRIFCLDSTRHEGGEMAVTMFEPGTGEALNIPANLGSFHDEELIDYPDEALAVNAYQEWIARFGQVPRFDQCVEYKTLLFLGGTDGIDNMHLSDLDVSWSISAQLIERVRGLPPGTKISRVSLS